MRLPVNPPPRFYRDHLLVPVRRIIEALGLQFEKHGRIVTTYAGAKTISLSVGSRRAVVDGEPFELDSPPVEIANVLYAPLRYFTDALGAQATFDRQTDSVVIVSALLGRGLAQGPSAESTFERAGTITEIDTDSDPPTLTLAANASVQTYPVSASAAVLVQDVSAGTENPGTLADVRIGDWAELQLDRSGNVKRIADAYGSRSGTIAAAAAGEIVLDDGHVIVPSSATEITLNGAPAAIGRLRVGDAATVRYNIDTNEPRQIIATRPSSGAPAPAGPVHISRVEIDPTRPLHRGDVLYVTLHGTGGGQATFDIGPYVMGQPMSETAPGLYEGQYAVPAGVNFAKAPVFGHLSAGGTQAPDGESGALVSVATEPPSVKDVAPASGDTVNDVRASIYATFLSVTVPVNPSSETIEVNGHDVTPESLRSARFIQYMPRVDLRPGPNRVTVRVSDEAGNVATKSWTFFVRTGSL